MTRERTPRGDRQGLRKNPSKAARGEGHPGSKFTSAQVSQIRELYREGNLSTRQLATQFNVERGVVTDCLAGTTWAHIPGALAPDEFKKLAKAINGKTLRRGADNHNTKLTTTQVAFLRVEYAQGQISQRALARKYNVTQAAISHILLNKNWRIPVLPEISVTLPIRTKSEANTREHWRVKALRVKTQRAQVTLMLKPNTIPLLPVLITLTRFGPRNLDAHDNLPSSFKAIVDAIAEWLGIKDCDPRVSWRYTQIRTPKFGVKITVSPIANTEAPSSIPE